MIRSRQPETPHKKTARIFPRCFCVFFLSWETSWKEVSQTLQELLKREIGKKLKAVWAVWAVAALLTAPAGYRIGQMLRYLPRYLPGYLPRRLSWRLPRRLLRRLSWRLSWRLPRRLLRCLPGHLPRRLSWRLSWHLPGCLPTPPPLSCRAGARASATRE